jgi:hypothetical protein
MQPREKYEVIGFYISLIVNEIISQQFLVADQPGNYRRSKHFNTRIYFIRDAILNGDVQLIYIWLVDRLTKPIYNISCISMSMWRTSLMDIRFHDGYLCSISIHMLLDVLN